MPEITPLDSSVAGAMKTELRFRHTQCISDAELARACPAEDYAPPPIRLKSDAPRDKTQESLWALDAISRDGRFSSTETSALMELFFTRMGHIIDARAGDEPARATIPSHMEAAGRALEKLSTHSLPDGCLDTMRDTLAMAIGEPDAKWQDIATERATASAPIAHRSTRR